jgi:hypothetical protein
VASVAVQVAEHEQPAHSIRPYRARSWTPPRSTAVAGVWRLRRRHGRKPREQIELRDQRLSTGARPTLFAPSRGWVHVAVACVRVRAQKT